MSLAEGSELVSIVSKVSELVNNALKLDGVKVVELLETFIGEVFKTKDVMLTIIHEDEGKKQMMALRGGRLEKGNRINEESVIERCLTENFDYIHPASNIEQLSLSSCSLHDLTELGTNLDVEMLYNPHIDVPKSLVN